MLRCLPPILAVAFSAFSQTYTISTVAGGGPPLNIPGTSASLASVAYVAADAKGNVFVPQSNTVLRLDASTGILTLVAGNGIPGFSGDGGPATSAQLYLPSGVAVDSAGNVYISDTMNNLIRKVSGGVVTTVAGNGTEGFSGDGGPATAAELARPSSIAVDSAGNLYIVDAYNFRIREVSGGIITTIAGGGSGCPQETDSLGDGCLATSVGFGAPRGYFSAQLYVAADSAGNVYISDTMNNLIRKISGGVITAVTSHAAPGGLAVDTAGNLYVAGPCSVFEVSSGVVTTVAENGTSGACANNNYSGDGGPATSAGLIPTDVAVDSAGDLFIADYGNNRIRKVSNGIITTVAGNGTAGDGGPATSAQLYRPFTIGVDPADDLYIADSTNNLVREVKNGVIETVAGNGTYGWSGYGGPAINSELTSVTGFAFDSAGNPYIAEVYFDTVLKLSGGVLNMVAGSGATGFSGDGGPATAASLWSPGNLAVDSAGNLYIADTGNCRIRRVSGGIITTFAGSSGMIDFASCNFSGDGGPASSAELNSDALAIDSADNLYVADLDFRVVREISGGLITTVVGAPQPGGIVSSSGDGGPATLAHFSRIGPIATDSSGNLYLEDGGYGADLLIRKVSGGVITTIAGGGTAWGDGGPATGAQLDPGGLAADARGNVYIADYSWNRVRVLVPSGTPCAYPIRQLSVSSVGSAGGNVVVEIPTAAGCAWAVQSLPNWITYSGNAVGSGPATVTLAVAANTGTARTAIVSVAGMPISVSQAAPAPSIFQGGVVNDASYAASVVPGSIAAAFGDFTLAGWVIDTFWPTSMAGLSLQFGGGTLAPLYFVSNGQVDLQVPWELEGQSQTTLTATLNGQAGAAQTVSLASYAPAIFSMNSQGTGQGAILDAISYALVDSTHPAMAGTSYISIFCTGLGAVTNQLATGAAAPGYPYAWAMNYPVVTIGGVTATNMPFYGLAPGFVGLYQVNAQVPAGSATGTSVPVTISIGSATSNTVTIAVQ